MVEGDITVQTIQVLANLTTVIKAAGGSLNKVVKTTVFLKNLDDFVAMNKVYGEAFGSHTPGLYRASGQITTRCVGGN